LDPASSFLYFSRQVLYNRIIAEDAFVEDVLGFVGHGIGGNISIHTILLLNGCHGRIQEWGFSTKRTQ
jgi:hypothetical protein